MENAKVRNVLTCAAHKIMSQCEKGTGTYNQGLCDAATLLRNMRDGQGTLWHLDDTDTGWTWVDITRWIPAAELQQQED